LLITSTQLEEFDVDFVSWCDLILNKIIEVSYTSLEKRNLEVNEKLLAQTLFGEEFTSRPDYTQTAQRRGMYNAVGELENVQLIERYHTLSWWKATINGRKYAKDAIPLWQSICQEDLEAEHEQFLRLINQLSPVYAIDHVCLSELNDKTVLANLHWPEGMDRFWYVSQDLKQLGFISSREFMGPHINIWASYRGLVWETRRGFTAMTKFIDDLVEEWETTNIDFKRVLNMDTADEKAEFIKDVLSLVNTKSSGRRWIIIGFDDNSHTYYSPSDKSLNQNRFEQLLPVYTKPYVEVRYKVVDYRNGQVGMLEILRDPRKLPYSVAKSIGDKKRIEQDDIFVRHGSQVEKPKHAELQALYDEGDQARTNNP
jgi:hypothetical protein